MSYEYFLEKMHMKPNNVIAVTRFYSEETIQSSEKAYCFFNHLKKVFDGNKLEVMVNTIFCPGFKFNTGLIKDFPDIPGGFEHFLSQGCNKPGCPKGERIKRNPELATKFFEIMPKNTMDGFNAIRFEPFKPDINSDLVICFVNADQLAGLTYLQNYDKPSYDNAIVATVSGCASLTKIPFGELEKPNPKAIIGSLDSASRIFHDKELISFTIPTKSFKQMISYSKECFFDTSFWNTLENRM